MERSWTKLGLNFAVPDVTAPNVTNVSLTNNASITWDAAVADSSCELNYEVSIYIDQELIDSGQTADNQYTFSMDSLSMCSVVSIELKAISNGEYESDVVTYEWMSGKYEDHSINTKQGWDLVCPKPVRPIA